DRTLEFLRGVPDPAAFVLIGTRRVGDESARGGVAEEEAVQLVERTRGVLIGQDFVAGRARVRDPRGRAAARRVLRHLVVELGLGRVARIADLATLFGIV